jgi:predicted homoserine dehydrogenase-like protein
MLTTSKPDALAEPVRVGLIGAGRIGTAHAETLARRVPGARLMVIADPRPGAAETDDFLKSGRLPEKTTVTKQQK